MAKFRNNRPLEVKQTVESTVEVRKTEVAALVESKLTIAEQKRELEIKKKLEAAKKHTKSWNITEGERENTALYVR
ncbi:hypothetical protein NQ318_009769 [Aromia moschata]|uniref:Uncharacterized protein n=1 Tax=Aromia moschata TaxID=1265417 RepID=A0AAV8Y7J0_9CUCU|nr:hypothetical protein NQ318_009769 [Aromia moschata]